MSVPRSGTNYLCSLLWSLDAHWCFYELFSSTAAFGTEEFIEDLSTLLGANLGSIRAQTLVDFADGHPLEFLDRLSEIAAARGMRSMSYKIFPDQLDADSLEKVLGRPGLKIVLLQRHPIDVFISLQKALKTGRWSGDPTTGISVDLNFEAFLDWRRGASKWFKSAEAILRKTGRAPCRLRYETDVLCRPEHLLRLVHDQVLERPESAKGLAVRPGSLIEKQDLSRSYDLKVSNWAHFCAEARERDALDTLFVY